MGLEMAFTGLLSCLRPCSVHLQGIEGRFALNLCGCPSLPVSIYRAIYIHRINAARLGGSRCGGWFLLLRAKTERLLTGRPSCHISVYLGRWFQSCGPLGLRYSTGSRGLWLRCGSCNNRLSGCVSSPWCGRFRGLQE